MNEQKLESLINELEKNRTLLKQEKEAINALQKIIKERIIKIRELEKIMVGIITYKTPKEVTEKMIPILKKGINEINLPTRSYNSLISQDICFVYQLVQCNEQKILMTRNLRLKSLNQIKYCLNKLGLELGMILNDDIKEKLLNK